MFGLKIFVRVQTFWRLPPVLPRNFCHPVWWYFYYDHRYPHYQNLNVIGFDLSELINFQDVPQRYGNADEQRPSWIFSTWRRWRLSLLGWWLKLWLGQGCWIRQGFLSAYVLNDKYEVKTWERKFRRRMSGLLGLAWSRRGGKQQCLQCQ